MILYIALTSHYYFRRFGNHYEIGENITQYQERRGLHNNLNRIYFLIENGFQFIIYTEDLFCCSEKLYDEGHTSLHQTVPRGKFLTTVLSNLNRVWCRLGHTSGEWQIPSELE